MIILYYFYINWYLEIIAKPLDLLINVEFFLIEHDCSKIDTFKYTTLSHYIWNEKTFSQGFFIHLPKKG
jgi:hypothetical protein